MASVVAPASRAPAGRRAVRRRPVPPPPADRLVAPAGRIAVLSRRRAGGKDRGGVDCGAVARPGRRGRPAGAPARRPGRSRRPPAAPAGARVLARPATPPRRPGPAPPPRPPPRRPSPSCARPARRPPSVRRPPSPRPAPQSAPSTPCHPRPRQPAPGSTASDRTKRVRPVPLIRPAPPARPSDPPPAPSATRTVVRRPARSHGHDPHGGAGGAGHPRNCHQPQPGRRRAGAVAEDLAQIREPESELGDSQPDRHADGRRESSRPGEADQEGDDPAGSQ